MIAATDLIRVSLRQVIRQKSLGVIFSIALGITAFISLAVLGQEIRYKVGQDMILMGGVNVIRVVMDDHSYPGQPLREFYPETVAKLKTLSGVGLISQSVRYGEFFPMLGADERRLMVGMLGIDEYFHEVYSLTLDAGRFINAEDVNKHRRVCVLGNSAAKELFGNAANAIGELITLRQDVFEIVGVTSGVMLGDWREGGFIPATTMVDRRWGDGRISRLFVRAIGWEDVPPLVKLIPDIVHTTQEAPYLQITTQSEQLQRIQTTFLWVEALLWLGIAASLMLGGFGIWYGTFSAVRARTREVGLKKAMGGSDADILAQFLAEALCKSIAGGILGIAIGATCVHIGAFFLGTNISYQLLAASGCGSIIFSAIIGIVGGIYPATQASRMDVVSALRFE